MKRNRSSAQTNPILKIFTYTFVLALTFSLGLVVGKRIEGDGPLLSLMSSKETQKEEVPIAVIDTGEEEVGTDYSFYELLGAKANDETKEELRREEIGQAIEIVDLPSENLKEEKKSVSVSTQIEKKNLKTEALQKIDEKNDDSLKNQNPGHLADLPKKETNHGKFTLQFGSHATKQEAQQEVAKLAKLGLKPYLLTVKVPERGTFYRVRVGKYDTLSDARGAQVKLQTEKKISGFVSPI